MLTKSVSRQEFLDLLQAKSAIGRYDVHSFDRSSSLHLQSTDLQLFWGDDDLEAQWSGSGLRFPPLPRIIVVGTGKVRDFLAWVWTYVPELRPLTAYVRILEAREMEFAQGLTSRPALAGFEEACLGLILTEAGTYVDSALDKQPNITPLSCASTFSNAMARTLALLKDSCSQEDYERTIGIWQKARALTRQRALKLSPAELGLPWKVLLRLYQSEKNGFDRGEGDDEIFYVCRQLLRDSEVGSAAWDSLSRRFPGLDRAWSEMQGTRERRVTFFEEATAWLVEAGRRGPELPSFLCGLLASQIGPGTLDYISLVAPHVGQFPTAMMWYGLCTGLQNRRTLYGYSLGLGRRVLREALREESILQSPQSDIALSELEVMTGSDVSSPEFRTGAQGVLQIEIAPMVTTTVRWPHKQIEQPELFPADVVPLELRELSLQLDELQVKTTQIQKRISRLIGERDSPSWKSGRGKRR